MIRERDFEPFVEYSCKQEHAITLDKRLTKLFGVRWSGSEFYIAGWGERIYTKPRRLPALLHHSMSDAEIKKIMMFINPVYSF
jgi:hypothetical protein